MKKLLRSALLIVAAALLAQITDVSPARADSLITSGGILEGVDGIDVGGVLYDVTFAQGTCAAAYGACADANFPFATPALADAATTALFGDINTSPTYQFDPSQIGLCTGTGDCLIYLPLSDTSSNLSIDLIEIGTTAGANGTNLSSNGDVIPDTTSLGCGASTCYQWAVWTAETTSSVPEPATITLFGAGLLGLALVARRRGANAPALRQPGRAVAGRS